MTSIGWVRGDDGSPGESWNPIRARNKKTGRVGWFCIPVHEGCKRCYASGLNRWRGNGYPYKAQHLDDVEIFLDATALIAPIGWKKPRRIFPCSMSDLYADFVPQHFIDAVKAVQVAAPQHTYIELTKRPARMRDYYAGSEWYARVAFALGSLAKAVDLNLSFRGAERLRVLDAAGAPLPNVWAGPSCSTQEDADAFIPLVLETRLAKHIVSLEPLLGPIDLTKLHGNLGSGEDTNVDVVIDALRGLMGPAWKGRESKVEHKLGRGRGPLDWAIVGFESGRGAREGYVAWITALIKQCQAAGVPIFVKQLGLKPMLEIKGKPQRLDLGDRNSDPKGEDSSRWPAHLRVQQFPPAETFRDLALDSVAPPPPVGAGFKPAATPTGLAS